MTIVNPGLRRLRNRIIAAFEFGAACEVPGPEVPDGDMAVRRQAAMPIRTLPPSKSSSLGLRAGEPATAQCAAAAVGLELGRI